MAKVKALFEKKGMHLAVTVLFWLCFAMWMVLLYLKGRGLHLIYRWPEWALSIIMAAAGMLLQLRPARLKNLVWLRRALRMVVIAAVVGGLALCIYSVWLHCVIGPKHTFVYTSPYPPGHRLAVLEGGFIDTAYSAQPVKHGLFYQEQNHIRLTRHDYWGSADVEVEWREDGATVYIVFYPDLGRMEEDSIPIRFAQ